MNGQSQTTNQRQPEPSPRIPFAHLPRPAGTWNPAILFFPSGLIGKNLSIPEILAQIKNTPTPRTSAFCLMSSALNSLQNKPISKTLVNTFKKKSYDKIYSERNTRKQTHFGPIFSRLLYLYAHVARV